MKRVLALLAAAAMVAGALIVRSRLDGGGDGGAPGSGPSGGGEAVSLVCVSEAMAACRRAAEGVADVTVVGADAAATAATLSAASFDPAAGSVSAWVAPAAWAAIVSDTRRRELAAELFSGAAAEPLARSPLVMVAWADRAAALEAACGAPLGWRCVGDSAPAGWARLGGNAAWGAVKPGHRDPSRSATGLLTLGHLAASYFGRVEFASQDLPGEFSAWLGGLERQVPDFAPPAGSPLAQLLAQGPSAYDVVGDTEAEARAAVGTARYGDALRVVYPQPAAVADLALHVVAAAPGAR
ncbi:MAG: hypothetical protein ACKVWR_11140, partial [Acidimicrobiales bacterium]